MGIHRAAHRRTQGSVYPLAQCYGVIVKLPTSRKTIYPHMNIFKLKLLWLSVRCHRFFFFLPWDLYRWHPVREDSWGLRRSLRRRSVSSPPWRSSLVINGRRAHLHSRTPSQSRVDLTSERNTWGTRRRKIETVDLNESLIFTKPIASCTIQFPQKLRIFCNNFIMCKNVIPLFIFLLEMK